MPTTDLDTEHTCSRGSRSQKYKRPGRAFPARALEFRLLVMLGLRHGCVSAWVAAGEGSSLLSASQPREAWLACGRQNARVWISTPATQAAGRRKHGRRRGLGAHKAVQAAKRLERTPRFVLIEIVLVPVSSSPRKRTVPIVAVPALLAH